MSLTLYELPHSPYCIPLKRIFEAVGQCFSVEDVPNWDRSKVLELTGGAYYQVPVIIHEGKVIHESGPDSNDIARYVDATFVSGRLFPTEHEGLHEIVINYLDDQVDPFAVVMPSMWIPFLTWLRGEWCCGTRNASSGVGALPSGGRTLKPSVVELRSILPALMPHCGVSPFSLGISPFMQTSSYGAFSPTIPGAGGMSCHPPCLR